MLVLGVSGSLQARSANRRLLEKAASVAPEGVEVAIFDGLRELPPFEPDVAPESVPAVEQWRQALRASDAVLFACPEYGFSLPGVVKNAIDWVIGTGELEGKVVAVTASVTIAGRGRRGLDALCMTLRAVSARIVGGRSLVRSSPGFADAVAGLLREMAREVRLGGADRPVLDVWFDFASTYSYLAVSRVEEFARRWHVDVAWRPFLLGPIFQKQGWNDSPFKVYPAKGRYMWRDVEREAAGSVPPIPLRRPSEFPRGSVLASRVAIAAEREAWCGPFVRAVFHANFAEDRDIGTQAVIEAILGDLGVSATEVLARVGSAEEKPRLRAQTQRAEDLGIFGAPTFVARGELFWGNDRLEQALSWARSGE